MIELCFNSYVTAALLTSFARSISGYEIPKSIKGKWKLKIPTPTIEGIKSNLQLTFGEWNDVVFWNCWISSLSTRSFCNYGCFYYYFIKQKTELTKIGDILEENHLLTEIQFEQLLKQEKEDDLIKYLEILIQLNQLNHHHLISIISTIHEHKLITDKIVIILVSLLEKLKHNINSESITQLQTKILITLGDENATDQLVNLIIDYHVFGSFSVPIGGISIALAALSSLIKWKPSDLAWSQLTFSSIKNIPSNFDDFVSLAALISRLKYLNISEELVQLLYQLLKHKSEVVRKATGEVLSDAAQHVSN